MFRLRLSVLCRFDPDGRLEGDEGLFSLVIFVMQARRDLPECPAGTFTVELEADRAL